MMRSPPSVSRGLLIAVALPLICCFSCSPAGPSTTCFSNRLKAALRERLDEQVVALVTAVDLDRDGNLVINQLDPEKRLEVPGSGQYASLRDENGKAASGVRRH
jgi:hypothetical protein